MTDLASLVGSTDIYLLDQLLRGRIPRDASVFDAGCGHGRNLVYFLREGYAVSGVDPDEEAIRAVRALTARVAPRLPVESFRAEPVEMNTFPDRWADFVICSAVLHFARDERHFRGMLDGAWRLVRPGGTFFCRLASDIGMEGRFTPIGDGRFHLPDGSDRFLVNERTLLALTRELGGDLLDPLKTTVVQNSRCMTTWVVKRGE